MVPKTIQVGGPKRSKFFGPRLGAVQERRKNDTQDEIGKTDFWSHLVPDKAKKKPLAVMTRGVGGIANLQGLAKIGRKWHGI